ACLLKPFSTHSLETVLKKAEDYAHLLKVNQHLNRAGLLDSHYELLGHSPPMEQLRALIRKVACTHATVLIQGESGVGKELVARAILEQSPRTGAPFIKVDCAAIPEKDLDQELFGVGGLASRSGASKGEGAFELAHG